MIVKTSCYAPLSINHVYGTYYPFSAMKKQLNLQWVVWVKQVTPSTNWGKKVVLMVTPNVFIFIYFWEDFICISCLYIIQHN